jgi:hypothetical protein
MQTINNMTSSEKLLAHFSSRLEELNTHYDGNASLDYLVDSFIKMDSSSDEENVSLEDSWFEAWSMSN